MFATQSQAKAIIARRTIEREPISFDWNDDSVTFDLNTVFCGNGVSATAGINISSGYTYNPISIGTGLPYSSLISSNVIEFTNNENKPVLSITQDGDVEWHGKPSEAAEAMKRTFQFTVEDMKGVTKAARRRYYLRACQNILNKAQKMEHDDFVAFLQKQVYNKERRVIMDSLKEE